MILNLGTVFFVFLTLLVIPVLLMCTRPCRNICSKCANKHSSMSNSFHGNAYFTFFMEGFLDIGFCATLNFLWMEESGEEFRWDTMFHFFNSGCFYSLSFITIAFPVLIVTFYLCNFSKWESELFTERYGSLLDGLRKDTRWTLGYHVIFLLRRCALIYVVTIGRKNLWQQIVSFVFFSTLQAGYLTTFKPSEEILAQKLDIFNEATTVMLVDSLTIFSAANPVRLFN